MDLNRGIDAATLTELASGHSHPVIAIALDWPGGYVRAHSGFGDLVWGGDTYSGVGDFGGIELPNDAFGAVPTGATLLLTGVPPDVFDDLTANIRNRSGVVYFGCVTEAMGDTLVGDLSVVYDGHMDTSAYKGERDGDMIKHGISITLSGGTGMRDTAAVTHSYEAQIDEYPGDTAGRHLQQSVAQARARKWPE